MNSVDCMDQRRSTNPTRRVEKRLHMSLFTLFLDLAMHNAYAVFQKIDPQKANCTAYREFKRIIAEQLVSPLVAEAEERQKKKEKSTPKTSPAVANGVLGSTTGTVHMLLENKEKQDENCFLCMLRWKNDPDTGEKWVPKLRTIYGCCDCKKGFHVNCFAAFHHEGALKGDTRALMDIIMRTSSERIQKGMSKVCKRVSNLSDLKLKSPEELFKKFESKRQKILDSAI